MSGLLLLATDNWQLLESGMRLSTRLPIHSTPRPLGKQVEKIVLLAFRKGREAAGTPTTLYSRCRTLTGSIAIALRKGIPQAASATAMRSARPPAIVQGSVALT